MVIVRFVSGSVLEAEENWILQQCNCVASRVHGLSAQIADKLGVDVYASQRQPGSATEHCSVPGTTCTLTSTRGTRSYRVINAFAQWAPGNVGVWNSRYPMPDGTTLETKAMRLQWFRRCLKTIKNNGEVVAVPHKIGCGLAGGDWLDYMEELHASDIPFVVYRLSN